MKVQNLRKLLSLAERPAGDGPKFAANFIQRRGHPNFEKNLSKLWPGPNCAAPRPAGEGGWVAAPSVRVDVARVSIPEASATLTAPQDPRV